jgi:hypothetical protein
MANVNVPQSANYEGDINSMVYDKSLFLGIIFFININGSFFWKIGWYKTFTRTNSKLRLFSFWFSIYK